MDTLDRIQTIDDYFAAFGRHHVQKASQLLQPLHVPGKDQLSDFSDMTREPFDALGALIELGVDRVLTSGQEATALEGLPMVAELVRRAESRIVVMPGGGITSRNVERIIATAKPKEIHFAALEPTASPMEFIRQHVFMGGELRPPEYDRHVTSAASIRAVMAKTAN